jgi:Spy/CpxP family protein refolding chaperone
MFRILATVATVFFWLVIFAQSQANAQPPSAVRHWGEFQQARSNKLISELKLEPQKAEEFRAVGKKYVDSRRDIIKKLSALYNDLSTAMSESKVDESKVSGLTGDITKAQNDLVNSLLEQRDEEMKLLDDTQKGRYLLSMKEWPGLAKEMKKKRKK